VTLVSAVVAKLQIGNDGDVASGSKERKSGAKSDHFARLMMDCMQKCGVFGSVPQTSHDTPAANQHSSPTTNK
jgi:hypothetical protein